VRNKDESRHEPKPAAFVDSLVLVDNGPLLTAFLGVETHMALSTSLLH
jgi:hypothetical protein